MNKKLTSTERAALLAKLEPQGWSLVEGRDAIQKSYKFKSFTHAFGWMTQAAIWSEKLNHHPEWSNTYNRVEVILTTHSADGLSALDEKLALKFDVLAD